MQQHVEHVHVKYTQESDLASPANLTTHAGLLLPAGSLSASMDAISWVSLVALLLSALCGAQVCNMLGQLLPQIHLPILMHVGVSSTCWK
jgi:vacuolar-type H+-ATPase subunit I/STV1